jgi:hypothetical protein
MCGLRTRTDKMFSRRASRRDCDIGLSTFLRLVCKRSRTFYRIPCRHIWPQITTVWRVDDSFNSGSYHEKMQITSYSNLSKQANVETVFVAIRLFSNTLAQHHFNLLSTEFSLSRIDTQKFFSGIYFPMRFNPNSVVRVHKFV